MVVASFHLIRLPTAAAARQLARVPFDRRALRHVKGVRFAKLLGTGRGQTMAASADLRRWAVFAVWDDDEARERFLAAHRLSRRWNEEADERFDVALAPLGAHGSWNDADPFGGYAPQSAASDAAHADRPIAVLTRATVRWRQVPAFLRAVPEVDRTLATTDGLLATVGIGEAPVGRQATFSLWRDADAIRDFAYRRAEHSRVVERTRAEGWYGEEWFARFSVTGRSGTWSGRDPLA